MPKPVKKPVPKPSKKSSGGKTVKTVPAGLAAMAAIADKAAGVPDNAPHVIVTAYPGTGKTTTAVEAVRLLKGIKSALTPSDEQDKVWKQALRSHKDARTGFVAFSRSIVKELVKRMPPGTEAMTCHAFGYRALKQRYGEFQTDIKKQKVLHIVCDMLGIIPSELYERDEDEGGNGAKLRAKVESVRKLVDLSKQTLVLHKSPSFTSDIQDLAAQFEIALPDENVGRHIEMVGEVLERCTKWDGVVDFCDMIWLPIVHNLDIPQYDLLLVDEGQDLSRTQQELVLRAGKRIILVGDPKQSIFGFAGADVTSMPRMRELLGDTKRGCIDLKLTLTRRCSRAVVAAACRECKMTEFHAHPSNCDGQEIRTSFDKYRPMVKEGDFVLCRTNAPLVREVFKFIKDGRSRVFIKGADLGRNLIAIVSNMGCSDIPSLKQEIDVWYQTELVKIKGKSPSAEMRRMTLSDKKECLAIFAAASSSPREVIQNIRRVFKDDGQGIVLRSVHSAKGLEARRVFLLQPKKGGIPHQLAKTPTQLEQENNLLWVAITRAIEDIIWVYECNQNEDDAQEGDVP